MSHQSLRVLIVEDSEDDTQLVLRALKKGGYNPLYKRVETAAAMKKALKEKQWDIILCEYSLSQFNAPSAINVLKEANIDIPLIVVTGTIGKETISEFMNLSVQGYIMKSNLSHLCPAIERELEEAEIRVQRKQADEALKKSENQYRLLANTIHDVVFVLDMNLNYTYLSPSVKLLRGYEQKDAMKHTPAETLTPSSMDLAIRTLSEIMEMEKSEQRDINISRTLELEMRRKDGTTVWTEVKAFFVRDENQRAVGIMGVTRDITERKRAEEQLQQTIESLRKAVGMTIQVLVSALESRDPYTSGHQARSADLACTIAREMGLAQDKIEGIQMAGSIHDIGKLSIPEKILTKLTKLTNLEFFLIKEHSQRGYEILKNVESPWPLAEIVYQHHERMNGSGYPRNLKEDEILLEARILAVADVVEAMASHRPYRPALGIEAALEEIMKNKGILYDNAVADACLKLFREKGYQFTKDGEINTLEKHDYNQ